jgi:prepilin signal peptidase PulO-like enzyme (type II secretory pathway)
MPDPVFITIACLIPLALGAVAGAVTPWKLRWVVVLGLALALVFWIASVMASSPDVDGGDQVPLLPWIVIGAVATSIALALFCAGAWLGRAGRRL